MLNIFKTLYAFLVNYYHWFEKRNLLPMKKFKFSFSIFNDFSGLIENFFLTFLNLQWIRWMKSRLIPAISHFISITALTSDLTNLVQLRKINHKLWISLQSWRKYLWTNNKITQLPSDSNLRLRCIPLWPMTTKKIFCSSVLTC